MTDLTEPVAASAPAKEEVPHLGELPLTDELLHRLREAGL